MQNSAAVSRIAQKQQLDSKDSIAKTVATEAMKSEVISGLPPKSGARRSPLRGKKPENIQSPKNSSNSNSKAIANNSNNNSNNSNNNNNNSESNNYKSLERVSSTTSLKSRRSEVESVELPTKLRQKFTRPRLNQLTEQRIKRLHNAHTEIGGQACTVTPLPRTRKKEVKSPSLTSLSLLSHQGDSEQVTCIAMLNTLQKKLEEMQTEFMEKVDSIRDQGYGYAYKLISIVHNENCKVLIHNDDLLGVPNHLPVHSVAEFKDLCHSVFRSGFTIIFEQLAAVQLATDEEMAAARRDELCAQLKTELDNKLMAVDNEILQLCSETEKSDNSGLSQQVEELSVANNQLMDINAKLDLDIAEARRSREELKKLLDASQKRNNELALELAEKNISLVEHTNILDDLRIEMKHMTNTNKAVSERLKEQDCEMEISRAVIRKHLEEISNLEQQLRQAHDERLMQQQKVEALTINLAERDQEIADQKGQLLEQDQYKDWLQSQSESGPNDATRIGELQLELERKGSCLVDQQRVEQELRDELGRKQEALHKAEHKLVRLEEQIEHHRQVLAVRSERINSLDQEMKQREQESNRKLNEIMMQTSDKNALITQITNELASTNEQFQNLCETLSMKQTKLHSQEHVIKLLEESNVRSVKLHTKLGEKNALLKDELDHLRRTVNNLMLSSEVSEGEAADHLLE